MIPIPATIAAAIAAICLLLGAWAGHQVTHNAWEAGLTQQAVAAAKTDSTQRVDSTKTESSYVQDLSKIVTPPADIAAALRSDCAPAAPGKPRIVIKRVYVAGTDVVPGAAGSPQQPADAAAAPDPDDGLLGHVAAEIPACVANGVQLGRLQELIRDNAAH